MCANRVGNGPINIHAKSSSEADYVEDGQDWGAAGAVGLNKSHRGASLRILAAFFWNLVRQYHREHHDFKTLARIADNPSQVGLSEMNNERTKSEADPRRLHKGLTSMGTACWN